MVISSGIIVFAALPPGTAVIVVCGLLLIVATVDKFLGWDIRKKSNLLRDPMMAIGGKENVRNIETATNALRDRLRDAVARPTFFNLVDLCGSTRIAYHTMLSEWIQNQATENGIKDLMNLTAASKTLLDKAQASHYLNRSQKLQVIGMSSNAANRVRLYSVVLDPDLSYEQKESKMDEISDEMIAQQESAKAADPGELARS